MLKNKKKGLEGKSDVSSVIASFRNLKSYTTRHRAQ